MKIQKNRLQRIANSMVEAKSKKKQRIKKNWKMKKDVE